MRAWISLVGDNVGAEQLRIAGLKVLILQLVQNKYLTEHNQQYGLPVGMLDDEV